MPIRRQLPRVIAVDEFKGNSNKTRFHTIIVDVEKKEIMKFPDRCVETLEKYFESCDSSRVEIVVMDMYKALKKAVQSIFDKPFIIADRFHFMRQAYWALDAVRRDVQKLFKKEHRLITKRSKTCLWMDPAELDDKGHKTLQEILNLHTDLKEAYTLKNSLNNWFKTSDLHTARRGLEVWFNEVERSSPV
jgi:transposase